MSCKKLSSIIHIFIIIIIAICFVFPFFYTIIMSLKSIEDILQGDSFFPRRLRFYNYIEVFQGFPFSRSFFNTLYYSSLATILAVLSSSFVAYGYSKIVWKYRDQIFFTYFAITSMMPPMILAIPLYKTFSLLGWLDTYLPLIVPTAFAPAFFVFIFRQFYLNIPNALSEAGKIEGANDFWIYRYIILPIARPVFFVTSIFAFFGAWNNFDGPLIYITSQDKFPLAVALSLMQGLYGSTNWNLLMAAAVLMSLFPIIIYGIFQKYINLSFTIGGLK